MTRTAGCVVRAEEETTPIEESEDTTTTGPSPAQPVGSTANVPAPQPAASKSDAGPTSHDWGLAPFSSGDAESQASPDAKASASDAGAPNVSLGPPTCALLCDCIIDICGNVLRIFEHSQCLPTCQGLSTAQLSCRMSHCRMGGTGADQQCAYALGKGTDLPAACK